jgi:23S rRNA (guanosine2251-2'-O)-methyltransferase
MSRVSTSKNLDLIYGVHPLMELLKAKKRHIVTLYTTRPEPKGWPQIQKLFPRKPFNIQYVSRDVLTRIAGSGDHQGFVAWVSPFVYRTKTFDPMQDKVVLLLDGIQDTRNLGAIVRSAYCTGVNSVIVPKRGAAPINASALKASAGLAEHINVYQPSGAKVALEELAAKGYHIYLTTLDKGENALEVSYELPCVLVIGSEGSGISKEIAALGRKITLPQKQQDISYNASVAAGIFLFLISSSKKLI